MDWKKTKTRVYTVKGLANSHEKCDCYYEYQDLQKEVPQVLALLRGNADLKAHPHLQEVAERGVNELSQSQRPADMGYVVYNGRCLLELSQRSQMETLRAEYGPVAGAWPLGVQGEVRNVVWQADKTPPGPSTTTWAVHLSVGGVLLLSYFWIAKRPPVGYVRSLGTWREWLGLRPPQGWKGWKK